MTKDFLRKKEDSSPHLLEGYRHQEIRPSFTTFAGFFGSVANFPYAGSQVCSPHESCCMTWGALPQCKEVVDTIQFCFRFDGTTPLERRRPWSAGAQERECM